MQGAELCSAQGSGWGRGIAESCEQEGGGVSAGPVHQEDSPVCE